MSRAAFLVGSVLVAFARIASAGVNSWTSNGPEGGTIVAIVVDPAAPATVYAGTLSGVYKSTNGGGSWSPINNGLIGGVQALAVDPLTPAILYVGTSYGGVFKSINGGGAWNPINAGLTDTNVYALAIDLS